MTRQAANPHDDERKLALYNKNYVEACQTERKNLKSLKMLIKNQIHMLDRAQYRMSTSISAHQIEKMDLKNQLKLLYKGDQR
jgi:hypothetical protein